MRQTAVLLCLCLSGTAFAADSQLMNLVMPDAKILAGVNATSAIVSPLGQFILTKIGQTPPEFITATGFNPLQDVTEVLAATAADPSHPGGLVLARGTFPVDKITAALTGGKANWQLTTYGGATLISTANPQDKIAHAVAFLGDSIAVAGDLASVKAAIDRSTGANSIDPALVVTINQLSASEDEWLVSSVSVGSLFTAFTTRSNPANGPANTANNPVATVLPVLKSVQSFNGGVKFGSDVVVTGQAVSNSPQNAAALNAVIKLGIALGASLTPKDPQLTQAIQLLQAAQVTTNGSEVDLSLSIPEAQVEALLNSLPARSKPVSLPLQHN
jgi:hypothetical protein